MRNDVSEDQVKAMYDKTPSCNQVMSWEEVKEWEPMYLILRNAAIQEQEGPQFDLSPAAKLFYGDKKPDLK